MCLSITLSLVCAACTLDSIFILALTKSTMLSVTACMIINMQYLRNFTCYNVAERNPFSDLIWPGVYETTGCRGLCKIHSVRLNKRCCSTPYSLIHYNILPLFAIRRSHKRWACNYYEVLTQFKRRDPRDIT